MDGLYGTTRPAVVNPERDIEIFYSYKPDRAFTSIEGERFDKLPASQIFPAQINSGADKPINLDGVYNLRLPLDKFNKKGVYSVYIRPKRIVTNIVDVSILLSYPDVRGIVFNINDFSGITDLTGYRVDFLDSNGNLEGNSRLITSCGRCSPKKTSVDDKFAEDTRYIFTTSESNLLFCTVTPSMSNSFKPNALPYIGKGGVKVAVSNTNFNPILLEVEMVEHDMDTISYMLEGSQVRDLDKGKIITFNDKNEIYAFHEYFTLKDKLGNPLYDVKVRKNNFEEGGATYKELIKE